MEIDTPVVEGKLRYRSARHLRQHAYDSGGVSVGAPVEWKLPQIDQIAARQAITATAPAAARGSHPLSERANGESTAKIASDSMTTMPMRPGPRRNEKTGIVL